MSTALICGEKQLREWNWKKKLLEQVNSCCSSVFSMGVFPVLSPFGFSLRHWTGDAAHLFGCAITWRTKSASTATAYRFAVGFHTRANETLEPERFYLTDLEIQSGVCGAEPRLKCYNF